MERESLCGMTTAPLSLLVVQIVSLAAVVFERTQNIVK